MLHVCSPELVIDFVQEHQDRKTSSLREKFLSHFSK